VSRRDDERVADILDVASEIGEVIELGRDAWDKDRIRQLAVERLLEIIGEAANSLSEEFRAQHSSARSGLAVDRALGHRGDGPEARTGSRPYGGRQVQVCRDVVGGRLIIHPPTTEVRPRLVRRPLEAPAGLGQATHRRVEVFPGQL
jgi:hypothetical protein